MRRRDEKRLLEAWLEPKNKWRIYKLTKRYAEYFWAEPSDLVQMIWVVLARRDSFEPGDDVVWLAQDALHNLIKNRKRTREHKLVQHFPHVTTTPLADDAENEFIDEAGEVFDDENLHATTFPHGEKAVIEKERVLTYRAFLAELKKLLDPVEVAVLEAGENESYDTTELQRKLRVKRDRIYAARRNIKDRAFELRKRWEAAGRLLPGFPGLKKEDP